MSPNIQEIYNKLRSCKNFSPNPKLEGLEGKVYVGQLESKIDSLNRDMDRVTMMETQMNQMENVYGAAWSEPWKEIQEIREMIEQMKANVQDLMDESA